jgi:hypothetical protein
MFTEITVVREPLRTHIPEGNSEEIITNPSPVHTFSEILERRFSRRGMLVGGVRAAFAGFVAASGVGALTRPGGLGTALLAAQGPGPGVVGRLGFEPVRVYNGDGILVARGYTAPLSRRRYAHLCAVAGLLGRRSQHRRGAGVPGGSPP